MILHNIEIYCIAGIHYLSNSNDYRYFVHVHDQGLVFEKLNALYINLTTEFLISV